MLFSLKNPASERRQRLGKSGLHSLMRDPRYFDANHKEHSAMVDLVRRGFELVFDEPDGADDLSPPGPKPLAQKRWPTILTSARLARPFAEAIARLAGKTEKEDSLPEADREVLGRRALLIALKSTRAAFPSGFDIELRALTQAEPRSAGPAPGPSTPPPPGAKPEKPKKPQGPEPEKKPENPEKPEPEQEEDKCEALRQEMVAREEAQDQILDEIKKLGRELIALNDERRKKMPSINDEDRIARKEPHSPDTDIFGFEKDTPEAQRRRRGRLPRLGIDLGGMREDMIRRRDTAQRRLRRAEEIDARVKEIKDRLNELHDANRIADREARQAASRHAACKAGQESK